MIIGMFHNFKIRQAQRTEEDRELEIIQELAESVLPFAEAISEACDICAELDCLLCFSEATNLYNYRRPQMRNENVIKIQQGRYDVPDGSPSCYDDLTLTSTGTRYKSRQWTHLYQTTSSSSVERGLIHTLTFEL